MGRTVVRPLLCARSAAPTGPSARDVTGHPHHLREIAGPECVGLSGAYDAGTAQGHDHRGG